MAHTQESREVCKYSTVEYYNRAGFKQANKRILNYKNEDNQFLEHERQIATYRTASLESYFIRLIFKMNITNITRNAALCMHFYEEHTDENVRKCKERIEKWGDVEICYKTFPKQPVVVLKQRIFGDPITYRKYREPQDSNLVEEAGKRKRFELSTLKRMIYF